MVKDRFGQPKGYAFITFERQEGATKAQLALSGTGSCTQLMMFMVKSHFEHEKD